MDEFVWNYIQSEKITLHVVLQSFLMITYWEVHRFTYMCTNINLPNCTIMLVCIVYFFNSWDNKQNPTIAKDWQDVLQLYTSPLDASKFKNSMKKLLIMTARIAFAWDLFIIKIF